MRAPLVLLIACWLPVPIVGWTSTSTINSGPAGSYQPGQTKNKNYVKSIIPSGIQYQQRRRRCAPLLFLSDDDDDTEEGAEPLSLSSSDLKRLSQLRQRQKMGLPIMILDAMLPGQRLECSLRDQRFRVLAEKLLLEEDGEQELGMIGFDPTTGDPLNVGVTVKILRLTIDRETKLCTLCVEADQMFEVQSEAQLDETESYHTVDVELIKGRAERALTTEEQEEAQRLHDELPDLIDKWLELIYQTDRATPETMVPRYPYGISSSMPEGIGDRAVWTAALVNPLPSLGVCLEIRPSMLVCQNDVERVRLAHASLQASIDHLSGKQRLF